MPGRHRAAPVARSRLRRLVGVALTALLTAAVVLGTASSAGAATTVRAQLTLSGLADADNPTGGSVIGIHPGDTVTIATSPVPTAGLDKLGLGGLVDGLLGGVLGYRSIADFSHLPGGTAHTVVATKQPASFTFPKAGTYSFTWSVQKLTLLGAVDLDLDGNQLAAAGIKLNASNQYVGQIVVADDPPTGGIGVQLPSVGVHPSLPVVGQLPSVSVPGVKVDVPVTLPSLLPSIGAGSGAGGSKPSSGPGGGNASSRSSPSLANVVPIPALVVPHGESSGSVGDGGGLGGLLAGTRGGLSGPHGPALVAPDASSDSSGNRVVQPAQSSTGADKNVTLAAGRASASQVWVVLAVVALIALGTVSATYARLYLLRRS